MGLSSLLKFAVEKRASDLHLSTGLAPIIRVDGRMRRLDIAELSRRSIMKMLAQVMSEEQLDIFGQQHEIDFSVDVESLARFRVNAFQQLRGPSAVFRTIPEKILNLEDIGAPSIIYQLVNKPRGIILVTGPTGSGKSTTLSAMVDLINERQKSHILTIEDPIEFIHQPKNCLINQRELGHHTSSYASALRAALREDPDVILVGEMRDPETIQLALTAAETGHLVLSTLHTNSATKAIDRIIDTFSSNDKGMVRAMLSESLQGIIAQTLVPRRDGGRMAAFEVMIGNHAVRNLIRENKLAQLYSSLQTGQSIGMQTMDQALLDLVRTNKVKAESVTNLMKDPGKLTPRS